MEFNEALKKVYKSSRKKEQLNDPFLLYSRLSDLIGDSYNEIKKARSLFAISIRVNLLALIGEYGEGCRKKILKKYGDVSDIITEDAFAKIVGIVYDAIYPSEKKTTAPSAERKVSAKNLKVVKAQAPKTHKKQKQDSEHKNSVLSSIFVLLVFVLILIGIAVVPVVAGFIIYGAKYLCDSVPWGTGQWIIGSIGASLILFLMIIVGLFLYDRLSLEYYEVGTLALFVVTIVSFVAKIFVAEYLLSFFLCVNVGVIISGTVTVVKSFFDLEKIWGWAQIVSIILNLILTCAVFVFNVT